MTDGSAVAGAVKYPIGRVGGAFMISREAKAFSQWTGLEGMSPYFRGRCGVLGEVHADVVVAAVGFFDPGYVRRSWEGARGLPVAEAVQRYAEVCHGFARRKLAGFPEADAGRLAELLARVVAAADPHGAPLFAGWRAVPLPEDAVARAVQLAHVLRELRGGLHLVAVLASGVSPLDSVLSGMSETYPDGVANAKFFGWPEPFGELGADVLKRREEAERLTDVLTGPAFEVLTEAESAELTTLLNAADLTIFGPRG
jgi:hypothetical protein